MSSEWVQRHPVTLAPDEIHDLYLDEDSGRFNFVTYLALRSEMGVGHESAFEFAGRFSLCVPKPSMDEGALRYAITKRGVTVADIFAAAAHFEQQQVSVPAPEQLELCELLTDYLYQRSNRKSHEDALAALT